MRRCATSPPSPRAFRAVAMAGLALALCGAEAVVPDPKFGPNDIETLFFINKSDDRNRVDYGLRLDENCMPVNEDAVFPYWREFENSPPVRTHSLKFLEYAAYGVASLKSVRRSAEGYDFSLKLKPLSREMTVSTGRGPDGKCRAVVRTTISEVDGAELLSAYVKLKFGWTVDYVEVRGRHPLTGADLCERLKQ